MTDVLITTYQRFDTINQVCTAWLNVVGIGKVWLLDGSGGDAKPYLSTCASSERFLYWPMPFDPQTRSDMCIGQLADSDLVVLADDDVMPDPSLLHAMEETYKLTEGGMVGLIGRTFHGESYRQDTRFYSSHSSDRAVRVGFVGVVQLVPRSLLFFDTRGMNRNCDDLWLCMREHPRIPKYVCPTRAFTNIKVKGMFHDAELAAVRQDFYAKYWMLNYKPEGLSW